MNDPNFKSIIWQRLFVGAIALGTLGFGLPAPASNLDRISPHSTSHFQQERRESPPNPPSTPPPNQSEPGGALNPFASSCNSADDTLKALIPMENPVLTVSEHPTFFFYVPFSADEVKYGEFSVLLWPGEQERLYKTRFALPEQPGIVSITLPATPEYALAEEQYYHWYFQLYCRDSTIPEPNLEVHGWVQRVARTPERDRSIQATLPDIWYDALNLAAERLQASPQDPQLQQAWHDLLDAIDAGNLAEVTIVGSVLPVEDESSETQNGDF